MSPSKISEAEWEVMRLLWARSPQSAGELIDQLSAQTSWRKRTIRTLIDRLVSKGVLAFKNDGKRNLYYPRVEQTEVLREESRSFLNRVFGGEPAAMLLHFIQETPLKPEEIKKLRKLLSEKER